MTTRSSSDWPQQRTRQGGTKGPDSKEFIECSIQPGEKYKEFTTRFDSVYKALVRKNTNCSISNNLLPMFIRHAAKLPNTTKIIMRSNVRWKNQDKTVNTEVYNKTIAAMNEICCGERHRSTSSQQIKVTATIGEVNMVQYKGECLYINGDPMMKARVSDGAAEPAIKDWNTGAKLSI